MNDLRSQRGFCGRACLHTSTLFILLICNVSSGRFYCELHSEELELADGAEPSSEVGHHQNRSGCSDSMILCCVSLFCCEPECFWKNLLVTASLNSLIIDVPSGFRLLKNLSVRQMRRMSGPATIIRCLHLMRSTSTPWTVVPPLTLRHTYLKQKVNMHLDQRLETLRAQTLLQILQNLMTKSLRSLLPTILVQSPNLVSCGRPHPVPSPQPPQLNLARFSSSAPPPQTNSHQQRVLEQIQITAPNSRCGSFS